LARKCSKCNFCPPPVIPRAALKATGDQTEQHINQSGPRTVNGKSARQSLMGQRVRMISWRAGRRTSEQKV
jgi:hypothetical protein